MRTLSQVILFVLMCVASPAYSQVTGSINLGFFRTQATAINSTGEFEGQSAFSYGDLDLGVAIRPNVSALISVGGFIASTEAGPVKFETRTISVPIFVRYYLSETANGPRGFVDVGPSFNFLKLDVTLPGAFIPADSRTKLGAIGGIGFRYPFSSSFSLIGLARYSFIVKQEEFNPSSIQVTLGLGFGG